MTGERKEPKTGLRKAVALRYLPVQNSAPVVTAAGRGWLAERIECLAREYRVPVIEDRTLADVLSGLNPGEEIPEDLFEAVAVIFAFIMEADRRQG
ncbi:MAG: EscU/YscU/HrcU family type III secretion system export apparatus switch protein [Bacillota bacterium]